ncbi:hypothetical protein BS78_07G006700 [Paspalum vaginatum]|nr:hypothetical protein BS78_07G006700 [Paspalum vaginatum]
MMKIFVCLGTGRKVNHGLNSGKLFTAHGSMSQPYSPQMRYMKLNFSVYTLFSRRGATGQDYWKNENVIEEMP